MTTQRKAVIVAAGRGRRLLPHTADRPKCMVEVRGRPLLEWQLDALRAAGIDEVVVVRGYRGDVITGKGLRFVENPDWPNNNILCSLICAETELAAGAVIAYSDILYETEVVAALQESDADIAVAVDRSWRRIYRGREGHPEDEAELVLADAGGRVTAAGKGLPIDDAFGEFIGMAKLTADGAAMFRDAFTKACDAYGLDAHPFQRASSLRRAYLTDLFQELAHRGVAVHAVPIRGAWMEIDVAHDLARARTQWGR